MSKDGIGPETIAAHSSYERSIIDNWKSANGYDDLLRAYSDAVHARNEARDCGQDDVCRVAPGCQRHREERNRELVTEAEALREQLAHAKVQVHGAGLRADNAERRELHLKEQLAQAKAEAAVLWKAGEEITSWDWAHLLVDHPDAEVVSSDVRRLETALTSTTLGANVLAALREAKEALEGIVDGPCWCDGAGLCGCAQRISGAAEDALASIRKVVR